MQGYTNVDVNLANKRKGVIHYDVKDVNKHNAPDSIDEIVMVHVLEHMYFWEAKEALRNILVVLKPAGRLVIECPDISYACNKILQGQTRANQRPMWMLYGDPKHENPHMVHRWGYNPGSLANILLDLDYVQVRHEEAVFHAKSPMDFRITANKPGK